MNLTAPTVSDGIYAWSTNQCYWDGRNYRLHESASPSGRRDVAPWNSLVKHDVGGPDRLHRLAAILS